MVETRLLDRYHLEETIAAGGMGTVWAARDERLGRRVAVKMLKQELVGDPRFVERFRREARAVAALGHPNIASVFDYGEDHDKQFIVMELVEGQDLARLLHEEGPVDTDRALSIAAQTCDALGHAHLAGVIHRDVKPANIIVGPGDRVKVTDFGIARAQGDSTLTAAGSVLGTAHYLSPEQAAGGAIGPPSDVYSMGCVLYEMLTGAVPFTGDSPIGIAMRHVSDDVPPPSAIAGAVPQAVDELVSKATAKAPEDRFADGREIAAALAELADPTAPGIVAAAAPTAAMDGGTAVLTNPGGTQEAPQTVWPIPGDRWEPRKVGRFVLLAFGILAAIAALLLLVNLLGEDDPPQRTGGGAPAQNEETEPAAPETVTVGAFVGQSYEDAEQQLTGAGLEVAREDVDSAKAAELVVEQDPAEGEELSPGETVTLYVSNGALVEEESGDEGDVDDESDEGGDPSGKAKGHDKSKDKD
ncbi:MAG: protein kinase [Actinomycetota bacterium]|nr:protein kinase [Actinomycetota bacterium]